jgi:membrane peptidoglycan carboxypeptidase
VLHDVHPYGWLTFREVIEHSSNIGTAKAAARLAPERLFQYIRAYGFGQSTGVGLPGEITGVTKPPSRWSKPSRVAIPMGQEVTVTALQLAVMAATVANDGMMMRPWIIKTVRDADGQTVQAGQPVMVRQVVPPTVAAELKTMLEGAVERGTGRLAKVPGYRVAGKTGTAQKVEGGVYSHSRFVASFVGFAPVDDPSWGVWSEARTFKTPAPSSATITAVSPPDGGSASGREVTVQWANSARNIFYYETQVSGDQTFNTDPATATSFVYHLLRHGGVSNPANSYTTPPLETGRTYFWRVRPRVQGDGTPVAWSQTFSFRVVDAVAQPTATA